MKKRVLSTLCALALCLGLLPVTAGAVDQWEHSEGSHSGWTELTSSKLDDLNYTLSSGKYYLSGTDPYAGGRPSHCCNPL